MKHACPQILAALLLFGSPQAAFAAEPAGPQAPETPASPGCGHALAPDLAAGKTTSRTVVSGGSSRTYLAHVPAGYDPSRPTPVVLNFHGFLSNPKTQNAASGFEAISDREGFILVTPDGGIGWRFAEASREANTAFVRDVVTRVRNDLCVDPKRVFAAGKSQGGFMASWLACAAPDLVASVAPVAGMYEPAPSCRPIPILEFHGTADSTIPFGGGHVLVLGTYPGAVAVMDEWARVNGCAGAPETAQITAHVRRVTYRGCAAETIQYITDAGHTWPGALVREGDGTAPADLPASQLIWDFFKAHPKP